MVIPLLMTETLIQQWVYKPLRNWVDEWPSPIPCNKWEFRPQNPLEFLQALPYAKSQELLTFKLRIFNTTTLKINSSPPKKWWWQKKTILSCWVSVTFQGAMSLKLAGWCMPIVTPQKFSPWNLKKKPPRKGDSELGNTHFCQLWGWTQFCMQPSPVFCIQTLGVFLMCIKLRYFFPIGFLLNFGGVCQLWCQKIPPRNPILATQHVPPRVVGLNDLTLVVKPKTW